MTKQFVAKIKPLSEGFLYYLTKDGSIFRSPTNSKKGKQAAESPESEIDVFTPLEIEKAVSNAKQQVHQEYCLFFSQAEREYEDHLAEINRLKAELNAERQRNGTQRYERTSKTNTDKVK
jgi:hypothetical protein